MAVKTNYFPLWEAENGIFRLTHNVISPQPLTNYTKLFRKYSHLNGEELAAAQEDLNRNFAFLRHLTTFGAAGETSDNTKT